MRKKTTHIRCYKDIVDDWNVKFPGVNHADLIKVAYNTSALKIESFLRNKNIHLKDNKKVKQFV